MIGFIQFGSVGSSKLIFSGRRPKNLGIKNGQLAVCPNKPNCVSSQNDSEKHGIDPFEFDGDPSLELTRIQNILENMEGITVITSNNDYIYAECKTPLIGFVDDLEFYLDSESSVFHVRSASRLGYRDFGKNRSRVEEIREIFNQRD